MGIGRFIKTLINPEAMGEEIIALQERAYLEAQKLYPGAEPHTLLAQVWLSRMAARGKNVGEQQFQAAAFSETIQFACVPPPKNARALGLYFIYQEQPQVLNSHPKFTRQFEELVGPVIAATKNGQMDALYRQLNPRLAERAARETCHEPETFSVRSEELPVLVQRIGSTLEAFISQEGCASLFNPAALVVLTKGNRIFLSWSPPDKLPFKEEIIDYVAINDLPAIDKCKVLMGDGSHSGATFDGIDLMTRAIIAKFSFRETGKLTELSNEPATNSLPPGEESCGRDTSPPQGTTLAEYAKELRVRPAILLEQLQAAGIQKNGVDDRITEEDKGRLLEWLRRTQGGDAGH